MFTFLLVLLIIDSLVLISAILLQSGKGNGLAASFGGVSSSADSLLGTRQAGNLLTKTSWWGGALFLFLSLILSIASTRQRAPKSVLDQAFSAPAPTAPATASPGAAAGIPLTPAAPSTAAPTTSAPATSAPATAAPARTAPAGASPSAPATQKP
jgi:preprotein translocase subunit SecG